MAPLLSPSGLAFFAGGNGIMDSKIALDLVWQLRVPSRNCRRIVQLHGESRRHSLAAEPLYRDHWL